MPPHRLYRCRCDHGRPRLREITADPSHPSTSKGTIVSKLLVDVRTPDLHPLPRALESPVPTAHLSLTERASLHLGLWLLLRSTRRANLRADRDHRSRLLARERHHDAHREATLRLHQLWPRP